MWTVFICGTAALILIASTIFGYAEGGMWLAFHYALNTLAGLWLAFLAYIVVIFALAGEETPYELKAELGVIAPRLIASIAVALVVWQLSATWLAVVCFTAMMYLLSQWHESRTHPSSSSYRVST